MSTSIEKNVSHVSQLQVKNIPKSYVRISLNSISKISMANRSSINRTKPAASVSTARARVAKSPTVSLMDAILPGLLLAYLPSPRLFHKKKLRIYRIHIFRESFLPLLHRAITFNKYIFTWTIFESAFSEF